MSKELKSNLITVRLSDAELSHLQSNAARGEGVSTYIRDLIRTDNNPMHDREMIASLRKIQADLRFCRTRIMRDCSDPVVTSLSPIFYSIGEQLKLLAGKDG